MAYPTDSGVTYTTKVIGDTIQPSDVNNLQTETSAIKTLLGIIGSAVAGTFYFILSEITGSDKAVGKSATQTLTNKTLTSPAIVSPTLSGTPLAQIVRASVAGGVEVENSAGTDVAIFGAGTTQNTDLYGQTTMGRASTDYHAMTGGTGTVTDTATGGSTNININVVPKGTGRFQIGGVAVPTNSSTDTLTNKTLTTPTITKPVMDATNPTAQTYSPAIAGTATLDLSLANQHRITMPAGNITIALSNDTNAQIFTVSILQDGTGSRTVTWFSTIRWAGGTVPTLTTTASKRDQFIFIRTGASTYDGFIVGQNI